MKNPEVRRQRSEDRGREAFTLIELLVVIAIIALLAAMIIPVGGAVNRHKLQAAAKAGRAQMELLIEGYHGKTGVYPPADTNNPALNPLFYELAGTTLDETKGLYTTKDGGATIKNADVPLFFGPAIGGFINSTKGAGSDEAASAQNFLKAGVKAGQYLPVIYTPSNATTPVTVLGAQIDGPLTYPGVDPSKKINPWRYNMATPTNNPKTFDLWIDVTIGGTTYRISNWSDKPQAL
jgi:prepilin-type N-terminal cleavage/methylation domain-containing protein